MCIIKVGTKRKLQRFFPPIVTYILKWLIEQEKSLGLDFVHQKIDWVIRLLWFEIAVISCE